MRLSEAFTAWYDFMALTQHREPDWGDAHIGVLPGSDLVPGPVPMDCACLVVDTVVGSNRYDTPAQWLAERHLYEAAT